MTAVTARLRRKILIAFACAGVTVLLSSGVRAADREGGDPHSISEKPISPRLQLAKPDAVIQTTGLSSLPKDILAIPQLKDLLSEDFLYYYETNEDRLGIDGALRRITYEHQLSLTDEILAKIFNTPAEVALWEGYDGRLSRFAMAVGTRGLAKPLELLFSAASNDKQFTKAGRLELKETVVPRPGAASVTVELSTDVYRLAYGNNQKIFIAVVKDRLLVFSEESMAMPEGEHRPAWAKLFATLFTGNSNSAVFLPAFQFESSSARHSIIVGADYLSFGYQRFFPSFKAIKFDMTDKGWSTSAYATRPHSPQFAGASELWKAVPNAPSLCFALPVDSSTAKPMLSKMVSPRLAARTAQAIEQLESASAVCWFNESKLYTPLVVMKVKSQPWLKEYLRDLFQRNVGGLEAGSLTDEQKKKLEERKKGQEGMFSFSFGRNEEEPIRPASFTPPFPISEKSGPSGTIWSRMVSSRYGLHDAKGHPLADKMRSGRYFNVTMAHWKGYILFSPDDRMVAKAIAVLDKRFPPVADTLARGKATQDAMVLINPGTLGQLVRQSSLDSLPSSQESIFRASVSRYLFPNLEKLNRYSSYALTLPKGSPDGAAKWELLQWQEFRP